MEKVITTYAPKEERLNIISHAIGLGLSALGLIFLLIQAVHSGSGIKIVSYTIFGLSMITLYLASTLYHNSTDLKKRHRLNVFDHSSIYILIAGTYTPFSLITLKGPWGWSIFGAIWGLAIAGIILKLFFTGRFHHISTVFYVLMGWIIIVAIKPLVHRLAPGGLFWLFIGGVFYTLGAVLYSIKKLSYNHAIFHGFVLLGTLSHFIAVYDYT